MEIVAHRRNTIAELQDTHHSLGVEVDIRSYRNELVIHHDPFVAGVEFSEWVKSYRHKLLILNVKEEGLEDAILEIVNAHKIQKFFFLDQSFPFLMRTASRGERRCAVRVSEYESVETALSLTGLIDWVWVDCFTRFPLDREAAALLKKAGFRLCLVSPELQGRHDPEELFSLRGALREMAIDVDAVCTKYPDRWS